MAVPYAHFHDEILLAPALAAIMRHSGRDAARLVPALSLYVMVSGIVLLARNPFPPNALCLPVVAVALLLYVARTRLVPLQRPALRESAPPLAVAE